MRTRWAPPAAKQRTEKQRFDVAVDRVLNSGLMYGYMESFWKYVDGEIPYEQFSEEMSP